MLDPHAADVVDLGRQPSLGFHTKLKCSACRPFYTRPVRKRSDPKTVVRCAQCGKKHSKDSMEVSGDERYE